MSEKYEVTNTMEQTSESSRGWEQRLANLWASIDTYDEDEFLAHMEQLLNELPADNAIALFERAAQRGELRPDLRVEVALDLLYGALYHRLLHGHAPLSDRFVADVVDMTLHGVAASPDPR